MAVTDVIIDKGATATDKGGMVFNVKAYGALGTALSSSTQDDTAAFQAAITAASLAMGTPSQSASSGVGSVVFVPHGIYRIKGTLNLPNGVSIRGAGMHTTQLLFSMATTQDGLVWQRPTSNSPFGVGGFLEDIDLKAESYTTGTAVRDLVVLSGWSDFALNRVRIYAASRYNLRIIDSLNITGTHVYSVAAGTSCLWIGASEGTVSTTTRFVGGYFQSSQRGPAADVAGLGLVFDGCVFEDSGAAWTKEQAAEAYGIRIRGGTVTLVGPYFEANRSWELIAGTDAVTANSAASPAVTVINPVIMPLHDTQGAPVKAANTGGFKFQRGVAIVQGGNFFQVARPLVFSTTMDYVHSTASIYPHLPEVEGGTFAQLPGTVLYKRPASGNMAQAGAVTYGVDPQV